LISVSSYSRNSYVVFIYEFLPVPMSIQGLLVRLKAEGDLSLAGAGTET